MPGQTVIAIDGPAGAGKSTLARRVAARLGFAYVDSGAVYRAVALQALRRGVGLTEESRLAELAQTAAIELGTSGSVLLDGEDVSNDIRSLEVTSAASRVSVFPGVRAAVVERLRRMAETRNVVMEGRDIGTVVFPDAALKIFLDADPAARARRRVQEMEQKGQAARAEEFAREIGERDRRDSTRPVAPLVRASDAVYVDTTPLSLDEVEEVILKQVRECIRAEGL